MLDADWIEHAVEPHPRVAEIGLVIAYPDRMPRRAIDDDDLDLIGPGAEFLKPASGTYSGPKTGETSAQNQNALNLMLPEFPKSVGS
jgi:hypothetical protein